MRRTAGASLALPVASSTRQSRQEFDEADADHTGRISMQNYIQWATKTPEVIQFYESLTAIKHKHRPKDDAPAE